ncbi:hypothetical protein NBRC116601_15310 [Cognatishimia sp. WU-CL00825]|uniref:hypothetical protein n=1 Tax=Cognatishimia sp. WU-CL00825 TaxID=3127658 RepID=UPI003108F359
MTFKSTYLLLGLLTLSACATPQEQCQRDAFKNVKALEQAVATAQANIDRGYGLQREPRTTFRYGICNQAGVLTTCLQNRTDVRTKPVALDLAEERRKLASAQKRLTQERARASKVAAQCAAQYAT